MNILRKGSIFFNFFCKKGAFHLPTLQVSGKTSSNLQVSGDIRQFSGYNFAVGSTRNLWITWGGSYPGMLAGWLGALSWLLTPEKQVKGNQWLNIRPQQGPISGGSTLGGVGQPKSGRFRPKPNFLPVVFWLAVCGCWGEIPTKINKNQ